MMMFGTELRMPWTMVAEVTTPLVNPSEWSEDLRAKIQYSEDLVRRHFKTTYRVMKEGYDRKVQQIDYQTGSKVLLFDPAVDEKGHRKKWAKHWTGPYTITEIKEQGTYVITADQPRPGQVQTVKTVHADRLKPYVIWKRGFKKPQVSDLTDEGVEPGNQSGIDTAGSEASNSENEDTEAEISDGDGDVGQHQTTSPQRKR